MIFLKMFWDSYISLCKTDCSTQNFTSLKHLISKTDFTAIKYSGQGSFNVKKGTIDKHLFLLKTIGIYPLQVSMILFVDVPLPLLMVYILRILFVLPEYALVLVTSTTETLFDC